MAGRSKVKERAPREATQLERAAQDAVDSDSRTDKIEALSRAFKLFSQETIHLESAHGQLKEKYHDVNLELEHANTRLEQKVEELDITTAYLRSIVSNMSQGLLYVNKAGIVTTYNSPAEMILAKPAIEVLFHPFEDSFEDDIFGFSIREALDKQFAPAMTSTTRLPGTAHAQHLEVDACYVQASLPHGEHLDPSLNFQEGLIVLVRDRTKIRQLKARIARNDRMKDLGEMAAMVAHEIRNPLGGIKGFASLLQRDLKGQTEQMEMAKCIVEGCDKLNRLVTNVLNYARPVKLQHHNTDLVAMLERVLDHVRIDEELRKGIHLSFEKQISTLEADIDAQLLESAILNLVVNAIQAMPDGGAVSLWLDANDGIATIRVSDTGMGIAPQDLEKIYRPFFTTKPLGNGFGLSEVFKVIQAHDGEIEATSELNKGTTFTIKLPLGSPSSERRGPE